MPEVRLIDANALLKKCIEGDGDNKFTEGYNFAVQEISAYIALAPTISPEVRHGRWIYNGYDEYPTCSYCKQSDTYAGYYCGNCGADMRTPTEVALDIADSVMMGGADNGFD